MRKLFLVVGVIALGLTACGSDSGSSGSGTVTVQVDNKTPAFNFEATSYFPNNLTVAPGTTVEFHSNFQGEPHTVTFGDSINKGMDIFDKLTPEQKQSQGPPPPEVQALKIPNVVPDDADFSDPAAVKLNQSGAQPCYLPKGQTAPGADPCPKVAKPKFDGTQPIFNSGLLKNDETFSMSLADNIKPGTYRWICLFHGPEMSGTLTVAKTGTQNAAAVAAAGKQQLDDAVNKLKPQLDQANADAKPGEVKAGISQEGESAGVIQFAPKDLTVAAGTPVTWNLAFHTVSFNAPEDARPDIVQASNGTWSFNGKTFTPVGYTPPAPPPPPSGPSDQPPAPLNIDGGTWNGTGFFNSGSINAQGDVFFKLTFAKPGTYKYECLIHPDMEGTIKVT
jgi:plastocyanin